METQEKNTTWEKPRNEIKTAEINNLRVELIETKDKKGNVIDTRVLSVALENLEDINKAPYGDNVLFRVKINPYAYESDKEFINEFGFKCYKKAERKSPLFKDLDVKIMELNQALKTLKTLEIQFPTRIKAKTENGETTEYYEIPYSLVKEIEVLNKKKK